MSDNKKNPIEGNLAQKKIKIVMDVQAIPNQMDVATFIKCSDAGFVLYDSDKGLRPKMYLAEDVAEEELPKFVDTAGKEVNLDDLQKEWEDNEFWKKETYKCKQSPLYYFTNYYSASPKPTQEEIDKFLEAEGFMKNDLDAQNDSDVAAEVNEKTREVREKFAAKITTEHLKDLKPVRDRIDQEYIDATEELRKRFAEANEISVTNEMAIGKKLVTTLMKVPVKEATQEHKYYVNERTGRWDKSLLRATDLDVLLRLWNQY